MSWSSFQCACFEKCNTGKLALSQMTDDTHPQLAQGRPLAPHAAAAMIRFLTGSLLQWTTSRCRVEGSRVRTALCFVPSQNIVGTQQRMGV